MSVICSCGGDHEPWQHPSDPVTPDTGEAGALREAVVEAAVEWVNAHDALTLGSYDKADYPLLERYTEACNELLAVVSQNRAVLADTPSPAPNRDDIEATVDDIVERYGGALDALATPSPAPTANPRLNDAELAVSATADAALIEIIADTLMDLRMNGPWGDGMRYQDAMRHYARLIEAAIRGREAGLDVERLRLALHSADVIHPTRGDGGYCHCHDRAAAIAAEYARLSIRGRGEPTPTEGDTMEENGRTFRLTWVLARLSDTEPSEVGT